VRLPGKIRKRDGSVVPFDRKKIERAIQRAANEILQDEPRSIRIASTVTERIIRGIASLLQEQNTCCGSGSGSWSKPL